jgi:hypothetical protein
LILTYQYNRLASASDTIVNAQDIKNIIAATTHMRIIELRSK